MVCRIYSKDHPGRVRNPLAVPTHPGDSPNQITSSESGRRLGTPGGRVPSVVRCGRSKTHCYSPSRGRETRKPVHRTGSGVHRAMKVVDLEEAKENLEKYSKECQITPIIVTMDGKPLFEMIPVRSED